MAELSQSALLTRLNIQLRDADNRTFTAAEKTEVLDIAVNDPYVFIIARDDSTTTVADQARYTRPGNITKISHINLLQTDGYEDTIDNQSWEEVGDEFIFDRTMQGLPASKTLVVYGKQKLTDVDLYPEMLQDYILIIARIHCFELLKTSLATRFLKNDITMSDLIQTINSLKQEAARLQRTLDNQRAYRA